MDKEQRSQIETKIEKPKAPKKEVKIATKSSSAKKGSREQRLKEYQNKVQENAQVKEYQSNFKTRVQEKYSSKVHKYTDSKVIEKEYKALGSKEVEINLKSKDKAREFAQDHPIFLEHKFGTPSSNHNSGWKPFKSNMNKSSFKGKFVGYEKKLDNGSYARFRLDWDPNKKAHYNVEMNVLDENNKMKSIKFTTTFDCNGLPCTEAQVLKHVEKLQQIGN